MSGSGLHTEEHPIYIRVFSVHLQQDPTGHPPVKGYALSPGPQNPNKYCGLIAWVTSGSPRNRNSVTSSILHDVMMTSSVLRVVTIVTSFHSCLVRFF